MRLMPEHGFPSGHTDVSVFSIAPAGHLLPLGKKAIFSMELFNAQ
jgi:hypothetical protein